MIRLLEKLLGTPDLARGSKGWRVRALQGKINRKGGADLEVDGKFGPKTKAAVKEYQRENGLKKVDGIAGPETRAALRRWW